MQSKIPGAAGDANQEFDEAFKEAEGEKAASEAAAAAAWAADLSWASFFQ